MKTTGLEPTGRSVRRAAAVTVLVTAALMPFGALQLPSTVSFVPALIAMVACFDLLSVILLVGAYRDRGDVRLLLMATAYVWSLVAMAGYALAFPGAVSVRPPLATAPSTAPYLYLVWHGGFPLILGLAVGPWHRRPAVATFGARRAHLAATVIGCTVAGGGALVSLLVVNAPSLPALIVGLDTSRLTTYTAPVVLPVVLASLVACYAGTHRSSGPERWSTIVVLVCLCDLILTYSSGHRFSFGWYCGRAMTLVAAGVVLVSMLASFRKLSAQAEHQAAHDGLTGLVNRRSAYVTLEQMIVRARAVGAPLGVISLDLDHFKQVNDQFGHATGDLVLAACSLAMTGSCRVKDMVARVGGEEFLIVLPDTDENGTKAVADKMRAAVTSIVVPALEWPLTASLGVTVLHATDHDSADLLRRADAALYVAKNSGRDRAVVAGAERAAFAAR